MTARVSVSQNCSNDNLVSLSLISGLAEAKITQGIKLLSWQHFIGQLTCVTTLTHLMFNSSHLFAIPY